jgi:hypothetical protein
LANKPTNRLTFYLLPIFPLGPKRVGNFPVKFFLSFPLQRFLFSAEEMRNKENNDDTHTLAR